jgi:hypothetical protein
MRLLHLSDADNRNSRVRFAAVRPPAPPVRVANGAPVVFRRYLAAAEGTSHDDLRQRFSEDYANALIEGDPEIDVEQVGRPIGRTNVVYLDGSGSVLRAAPNVVELLMNPDGSERERRAPVDVPANVLDDAAPVRFGKVRMKRAEAARRFAFGRTVQLLHVDGVTYDYLHAMAKSLDEADEVVVLGGGSKGREPLVFQLNGLPWRGFLEGRVDGPRYQLLLRLSNLELKTSEVNRG